MSRAALLPLLLLASLSGCLYGYPRAAPCKHCQEPFGELDKSLSGCGELPYMVNGKPDRSCIASAYLSFGGRLLELKDYGGASRAYWASTFAITNSFQSRRGREKDLARAFDGLAKAAEGRGQKDWAGMLGICRELSNAYADSEEGKDEEENFKAAQERIREARERAQQQADEAREAASNQALMLQFRASNNMASLNEVLTESQSISEQRDAANDAMSRFDESAAQKERAMLNLVNDQFMDVDQQRRFVAERTANYLQRAKDARPYVAAIAKISKEHGWQDLDAALQPISGKETLGAQELEPLVNTIVGLDTAIAKRERVWAQYSPPDIAGNLKAVAAEEAARKARYEQMARDQKEMAANVKRYRENKQCSGSDYACEQLFRCRERREGTACNLAAYDLESTEPKDPQRAAALTDWACQNKIEGACERIESKYLNQAMNKNDKAIADKAIAALDDRCTKGSANACTYLATAYSVWSLKEKSMAATEHACELNHATSCYLAGIYRQSGYGVTADPAMAKTLFDKACTLGQKDACTAAETVGKKKQK